MGAEDTLTGEQLLALRDLPFMDKWRAIANDPASRENLGPLVVAQCVRRYHSLTPYIEETSRRLREKQERVERKAKAQRVATHEVQDEDRGNDAPAPAMRAARPLDWRSLDGRAPPDREWAIRYWLGMGYPTLLVGPSGAGKTLLCQQVASALAIGRGFLGEVGTPRRVLMWACEDDHDELWRRQQAVAQWLGVTALAQFDGFTLVPRFGMENTLFATAMGTTAWTPLLAKLIEEVNDTRADIVILDNLAQVYGANENSRHETTAFVNGLHGALGLTRSLLLVGHPSRAPGSEFSGSSAWEAAVRMRLYFASRLPDQKPDEEAEDEGNADNVRYLAKRKANYTERDVRRFTFTEGALHPDAAEVTGGIVGAIQRDRASRVVIEAARKLTELGVRFASDPRSPAYLPKVIQQYKLADGCLKSDLSQATRDAIVAGKLVVGTGWSGSHNKVQILRVAEVADAKKS